MAVPTDTPTTEPTVIVAGDSLVWTKALTDFPATDWTLNYKFFPRDGNDGDEFEVTAAADGTTHKVNVVETTTANYTAKHYVWNSWAAEISGVRRYQVDTGTVEVEANPATVAIADRRTHARKVFDYLEENIENLVQKKIRSVSVEGQSYQLQDMDMIMKIYNRYKSLVIDEEDVERIENGGKSSRQILARFINS